MPASDTCCVVFRFSNPPNVCHTPTCNCRLDLTPARDMASAIQSQDAQQSWHDPDQASLSKADLLEWLLSIYILAIWLTALDARSKEIKRFAVRLPDGSITYLPAAGRGFPVFLFAAAVLGIADVGPNSDLQRRTFKRLPLSERVFGTDQAELAKRMHAIAMQVLDESGPSMTELKLFMTGTSILTTIERNVRAGIKWAVDTCTAQAAVRNAQPPTGPASGCTGCDLLCHRLWHAAPICLPSGLAIISHAQTMYAG
jgi:hypothetical protein